MKERERGIHKDKYSKAEILTGNIDFLNNRAQTLTTLVTTNQPMDPKHHL
jgi:hypothetical protein